MHCCTADHHFGGNREMQHVEKPPAKVQGKGGPAADCCTSREKATTVATTGRIAAMSRETKSSGRGGHPHCRKPGPHISIDGDTFAYVAREKLRRMIADGLSSPKRGRRL
jgi:hypothetical protein